MRAADPLPGIASGVARSALAKSAKLPHQERVALLRKVVDGLGGGGAAKFEADAKSLMSEGVPGPVALERALAARIATYYAWTILSAGKSAQFSGFGGILDVGKTILSYTPIGLAVRGAEYVTGSDITGTIQDGLKFAVCKFPLTGTLVGGGACTATGAGTAALPACMAAGQAAQGIAAGMMGCPAGSAPTGGTSNVPTGQPLPWWKAKWVVPTAIGVGVVVVLGTTWAVV